MTMTKLLVKVVFTILLLALTTEVVSLVGDLMSSASDFAVLTGMLLIVAGFYTFAEVWLIIWRKR